MLQFYVNKNGFSAKFKLLIYFYILLIILCLQLLDLKIDVIEI